MVTEIALQWGASLETIHTSPDFRRLLLRRGSEAVVIDLVRERVQQMVPEKPVISGIRVDPPEEILANKLCTLLERAEIPPGNVSTEELRRYLADLIARLAHIAFPE